MQGYRIISHLYSFPNTRKNQIQLEIKRVIIVAMSVLNQALHDDQREQL